MLCPYHQHLEFFEAHCITTINNKYTLQITFYPSLVAQMIL